MKYSPLLILFVFIFGCKTNPTTATISTNENSQLEIPIREYSVQTVLWQQRSAEYKAICYQTFQLAKLQLDKKLEHVNDFQKPFAIITDVDETVLDNSPFNAKMIEDEREFESIYWKKWGELEQAKGIPGALEFLNYASSKGVEIFYISNRRDHQIPETMNNLKKLGFPNIESDHFLFKTESSGKETRRQTVAKNNEIVMLLGDNLSDFSELFDKKSTKERNNIVDDLKTNFGSNFIVLPNPMYGDWEMKGIYEGNYNWSPAQKDSLRKAKLITY